MATEKTYQQLYLPVNKEANKLVSVAYSDIRGLLENTKSRDKIIIMPQSTVNK